jgi:hypothetical protein
MGIVEDYFAEKAPEKPCAPEKKQKINLNRCFDFFNEISKSWQIICSTPNDYGADFFYSVTVTYSAENGSGIKVEKYGETVNGLENAIVEVLQELRSMDVEIPEELVYGRF